MKSIRKFALTALCLTGCLPALRAQFLVSYQGANGTDSTVAVYNTVTGQLAVNPPNFVNGAFKFLSTSSGAEHFFVSHTNGQAITVIGQNYIQRRLQPFGNFSQSVTNAAITPDDTKLVVAEATVRVFDITSILGPYPDLAPGGIAVPNSSVVADIAIDYDSQTIYALGTGATQSYLSAISLSTFTVTQTLTLPTIATSVTIAPNGLLYVASPNTITEIDPVTLAPTTGGTITVNITPDRPVFTPAGQYLVTANKAPVAGASSVVLIDLSTHMVAGTVPVTGVTDAITQLTVISDSMIYAYVAGSTTLYVLQIGSNGGMILNPPPFAAALAAAGASSTTLEAFTTSPDLGAPGRNAPQYVFVADSNTSTLFVIDPVALTIVNRFALQNTPGALAYFVPTLAFNPTQTVLVFGNNQTIPLGGATLPLVIRALDANGLPLAGQGIDFFEAKNATGGFSGTLTPQTSPGVASLVTGADGYAEVFFTGGNLSTEIGPVTINTDIGNSPAFIVNLGTSTPATPATLGIVSGQGQIVYQNQNPNPEIDPNTGLPLVPLFASTPLPLTVIAKDASGNPLPNVTVVFTILTSNPNSPGASQTQITDSTGQATATFNSIFSPEFAPGYPNFATETIAATAGTLTANFFLTTVPYAIVNSVGCVTPPCTTNVPQFNVRVVKPAYGSSITGSANSTLPGAIQVIVSSLPYALPVANVGLSVSTGTSTTTANARCAEPTGSGVILTDVNGMATCDLLLNDIAGTAPLSIFVTQQSTGVAGFSNLTITQNAPATVTVTAGDQQIANTGTTLATPFTIQVTDATKNPIPFAPVTWKVTAGDMTLTTVSTLTDINGNATATGVLGITPGLATVTATAGTVTATFTVTAGAPAGNVLVVSGDMQTAQQNTAFAVPLVVQVLDTNGNPAPFAGVTFAGGNSNGGLTFVSTPAGATSVTVVTDANGQATASILAGTIPGAVTVTAISTGGSASTFFTETVLTPGPSSVQVVNGASFAPALSPGTLFTITGANLTPTIQNVVTDPNAIATSGYILTVGGASAPILALINQNGGQQINAQVPFEVTTGPTTVSIQTPQGTTTVSATIAALSPGIFTSGSVTVNGSTFPEAVALRPDGSYVSAANPAHPGEAITFFATGMGQTTPTAVTSVAGVPGQILYSPLYVAINHLSTSISSAVYAAGANGLYSITVQVPSTTTTGPGQPLSLFMLDSAGLAYNAPDAYIPIAP